MLPETSDASIVSVIVCTRDRPEQLIQCIAALQVASQAQNAPPLEVLVIENGSSPACVLREEDISGAPESTKLLRLADGNLSMARNFGMLNARGGLFAFVDDDCLVDPSWLVDIARHWQAMSTDFLMGGRVKLADPADLSFTIKDVGGAQVFSHGVHPGGFVQGCNFIVPRTTADRIGIFDARFGAGGHFRAGEDTDFIIRANELGIAVHYVPDMVVLHRHGRRSVAEIKRLNNAYAYANGAILAKHVLRHPWLAKHLAWTIRSSIREKIGGPCFDEHIGLDWGTVAKYQLIGVAAYLRFMLKRSSGYT